MNIFDLRGELAQGNFNGSAALTNLNRRANSGFSAFVNIEGMDLQALAGALGSKPDDKLQGRIFSNVVLSGSLGDQLENALNGKGSFRIKEGRLFQIALFGGLSKILGKIYPGFGYAAQTELRSDFEIGQERVHFRKLDLQGEVISIGGSGSIGFDQSLNFTLQAKLLKKGLIAEVLRIVTSPLTFLLELRVTGSIRNPQWRPENLPKELFLIFD